MQSECLTCVDYSGYRLVLTFESLLVIFLVIANCIADALSCMHDSRFLRIAFAYLCQVFPIAYDSAQLLMHHMPYGRVIFLLSRYGSL